MYGLYVTSMTDDLILQQVHDDWKQKGFPYYPKDRKWRDNIFNKLINFKRDTLVDRKNKNYRSSRTRS